MSVNDILEELPKLSPEDRHRLRQELEERYLQDFEETPEMLAAIDEGLRSAEQEPLIPIEQVIEKIRSWNTKSP
jgi:predicted transcriptional regulator